MFVSSSIVAIVLALVPSVAADPSTTVDHYLSALRGFDQDGMNALLAADALSESPNGSSAPVDRERMRDMRGFERMLHTKWSWTVADVTGESVTVSLVEENDFYQALGSGVCTQLVVYRVANGRIARMTTRKITYSGVPFRDAFQAFEAWLLTTDAVSDNVLLRDGHVRFTSESAQALVPWLRKWQATRSQ